MRTLLLATSGLFAVCGPAIAVSLQSGNVGGMPYVVLPAKNGCSAAAPCSVVTYLSYFGEAQGKTASDVQSYFGGAFAQRNPNTVVIAPSITQHNSESVSWGGYLPGVTEQQKKAVAVVKAVVASMGNTVNPANSVVTGGSLGGSGTQGMLLHYGPKGLTEPGVFKAGLSFDGKLPADYTSPTAINALKGVPILAVHAANDRDQSISYDQTLAKKLPGSFILQTRPGVGHGTWDNADGYPAGVGPGTPLGWLSDQLANGASPTVTTPNPASPSTAPNEAAITPPSACATAASGAAGAPSGEFRTINGQIYSPDGTPFIAHGVNVYSTHLADAAAHLTSTLPGVNLVRVIMRSYDSVATLRPFVEQMTAQHIVVELEHHPDGGGAQGFVYTGQRLAEENAWYSSQASAHKTNPYVWFGTYNEPPTRGGSLSQWQKSTYDAVRNTGNNNPIMLEVSGSRPHNLQQALDPAVYAKMTNVIWDPHAYNYQSNYSADQSAVDASVHGMIAAAQKIQSADGKVPVIIGEYGNSTTGGVVSDPGGMQQVKAVQSSGVGSAAFTFTPGIAPGNMLRNNDGSLTEYGKVTAAFTKAGGTPSGGALDCAQNPIPEPIAQNDQPPQYVPPPAVDPTPIAYPAQLPSDFGNSPLPDSTPPVIPQDPLFDPAMVQAACPALGAFGQ